MWRRATLDFAEARRLPPRGQHPKYILKRGGNVAGASELPHIVMELNAP